MVLDALYTYFKSLPDAPIDAQGCRALRLVFIVDEARRVLGYGQPSLSSLVRESRSKGVSVFLISQSPDDFKSEEDNFLENIGLGVCFKTNATSSRVLTRGSDKTPISAPCRTESPSRGCRGRPA